MQETWVQSLGWEDPLEKKMADHSSFLAWEVPWTEEPGQLESMARGSQRVRCNLASKQPKHALWKYEHNQTVTIPITLKSSLEPFCDLSFPLSLPLGPRQPLIYLLLLQVSLHFLWQSFSTLVLLTLGPKRWNQLKKLDFGDFPGGPVAKTPCSQRRGPGSIPGQGTRSCVPQLRAHMPPRWSKILPAATKTWCSQINEFLR